MRINEISDDESARPDDDRRRGFSPTPMTINRWFTENGFVFDGESWLRPPLSVKRMAPGRGVGIDGHYYGSSRPSYVVRNAGVLAASGVEAKRVPELVAKVEADMSRTLEADYSGFGVTCRAGVISFPAPYTTPNSVFAKVTSRQIPVRLYRDGRVEDNLEKTEVTCSLFADLLRIVRKVYDRDLEVVEMQFGRMRVLLPDGTATVDLTAPSVYFRDRGRTTNEEDPEVHFDDLTDVARALVRHIDGTRNDTIARFNL